MMETLAIGWPQLIYVALTLMGLGYAIAKHREPAPAYSMWRHTVALAIVYPLLYWGGFFTN